MKVDYWDSLARSFDDEVFNPVEGDFRGTIVSAIASLSSKNLSVVDIGCGIGRNLALLARNFKHVGAVDISEDCLQIARRHCRRYKNIDFQALDLSRELPFVNQYDVGVCLNVALLPTYSRRTRLLQNINKLICTGGSLIFLVPSVESVLLTTHRLVHWNLDDHPNYQQAAAAASAETHFTGKSIRDGIIKKGGTPTKHYLREELELLMAELGQKIIRLDKVEYAWDTEFDSPPQTMQAPFPWDWLVISEKL